MFSADLEYRLPEELIAQQPPAERDGARLCVLDQGGPGLSHRRILDLPGLLPPALFVVNDTRVVPARLLGKRESGGKTELLLVERLGEAGCRERWIAMGRPLKQLRAGTQLQFGNLTARVLARVDHATIEVELESGAGVMAALQEAGQLPLPPYIRRPPDARDRERYQTLFADSAGAVAAPTAGLHFSARLLASLTQAGHRVAPLTLHVGPGTFAPLKAECVEDHPMHAERYHLPEPTVAAITEARQEGRPVVAVGTTVVRTLEGVFLQHGALRAGPGQTDLCIQPPWRFRVIDALLTNFHLPRSTLLALVMAFGGEAQVRAAYEAAVAERYRFFSYGDAMLLRGPGASPAVGAGGSR